MATVRHDKPSCEDDRQSEQGPGDQRYQPAAGESRTSREAEGACAQCGDSEQFRGPDCKDERAVLQIACARYREQIGQEPIWVERKGDISNPIHWIAGNPKEYRRKAQPLTYDRKVRVRVLYSTLSSFHKRAAATIPHLRGPAPDNCRGSTRYRAAKARAAFIGPKQFGKISRILHATGRVAKEPGEILDFRLNVLLEEQASLKRIHTH